MSFLTRHLPGASCGAALLVAIAAGEASPPRADMVSEEAVRGEKQVRVSRSSDLPATPTEESSPKAPADPRLIPVTPAPGFYPENPSMWMDVHRAELQRVKKVKGPFDVLLLGDSITLGWSNGGNSPEVKKADQDLWATYFPGTKVVNLGVGGDATQNLLWRMENGEIDGLKPRLVVLAIGINNIWNSAVPADAIAQGVKRCVEMIRTKLPDSRVLVVNPFPTQELAGLPNRVRSDEARAAIRALHLANDPKVSFVDFGDKFLGADGRISRELMRDFLHPTLKGYEIYAEAIAPYVREAVR